VQRVCAKGFGVIKLEFDGFWAKGVKSLSYLYYLQSVEEETCPDSSNYCGTEPVNPKY
jgi:hypothetical protein